MSSLGRENMPRTRTLRHLLTGTPCDGPYCEECLLAWLLDGNLYYTVADDGTHTRHDD